ncbi:acyl-CoA thioesterase [Christiangramia echinicola]|uniref:acyl-CoA thioesterase n=1 Tax=Christiangramia echinicola TaxID=279359 RepID=UPI00047B4ADD|nr:acyl-CoA thioesterase [Christiangramia echinicola]
MIHYWYTIIKILALRKFQTSIALDESITRTFRVRLFDCDGLRVMTASKYPAYMDYMRWELIARSKLYKVIVGRGMAPTLGSQKIIYRKPLKLWTKFEVKLVTAGWDDKWVYHLHYFIQEDYTKAIGVTRALIWKKDVPHVLADIIKEAGGPSIAQTPSEWVLKMFRDDKNIIEKSQFQ